MKVLVAKVAWLAGSETFIRNQVDAVRGWTVIAVGLIREASPLVLDGESGLYGDSALDRLRFRLALRFGSGRLTRMVRNARPDVMHVHFASDALSIAPSARRTATPLVVTLHGHDVTAMPRQHGRRGRRYRRRLQRLFRDADLLLAVSEHIRRVAVDLGAQKEKVLVHHIGVPIPVAPTRQNPSSIDLLFIGRLTEKKGVGDLISAVGMSRRPEVVRLVVAGDGPLRPELVELAARTGVHCDFVGSVDRERVRTLLSAASIVAVPSRTARTGDTEGLPTVAVEAAASGVPVVGTRHAGIPEIVVHGETGLLVDEGDQAALAAAIDRLLGDDELRARMGREARARAEQYFDIQEQTCRLQEIYAALVPAPDGPLP